MSDATHATTTTRTSPGASETARIADVPAALIAPGAAAADYTTAVAIAELPPGSMRRVSRGDVDVLLAHTGEGIVATDDRCPHMAAPLSIGRLEGCVVDCPLHSGRFDLCTGETIQFPTTGGLDPAGAYHPTWSPAGGEPKPEPSGSKAQARALTRVRRMRYYPVRIRDGMIEVAVPW
jgi:naphthalene 1,2-dioxygenase ferredoxin component